MAKKCHYGDHETVMFLRPQLYETCTGCEELLRSVIENFGDVLRDPERREQALAALAEGKTPTVEWKKFSVSGFA